jgi:hypothetical protein
MRFVMKVRIPVDKGNEGIKGPAFGQTMKKILEEIRAEAAYFSTIDGQRGAFVVVNLDSTSEMIKVAEPFFLWLNADVEYFPVMTPEDLQKGEPYMINAVQNYGK